MPNNPVPDKILDWLLSGDVSIVYQTRRDLLGEKGKGLNKIQERIATEGWGKQFLANRGKNGQWGKGFYLPKWTSTHYTLLDIKNLGFPKGNEAINESIELVLNADRGIDGGINYSMRKDGDVCVNGMILNFASYFLEKNKAINEIVDYILHTTMADGGWNCKYRKGDTHSSLHTTLSVLEGFLEYRKAGNTYRLAEIKKAEKEAIEFLLVHKLYKSHRTGNIIDPKMIRFTYPTRTRWRYDILRALDYLQSADIAYDKRMQDALDIIISRRGKDGLWLMPAKYTGLVHFEMEKAGQPGRWNTLRALRVLKHFNQL